MVYLIYLSQNNIKIRKSSNYATLKNLISNSRHKDPHYLHMNNSTHKEPDYLHKRLLKKSTHKGHEYLHKSLNMHAYIRAGLVIPYLRNLHKSLISNSILKELTQEPN